MTAALPFRGGCWYKRALTEHLLDATSMHGREQSFAEPVSEP
jgi:hypothetical protein